MEFENVPLDKEMLKGMALQHWQQWRSNSDAKQRDGLTVALIFKEIKAFDDMHGR